MVWRIFRIVVFMIRRLIGYLWCGLRNRPRQTAYRIRAYVAWAHYVLKLFEVDLEVEGRERVPPSGRGTRIFLCNHQSQLDIPVLVAALGEELGFVAKKELGRIPLLAFWMRQVGCVFIDRSDKFGARKSLETAALSMRNHTVVVFPEGTRSKSGALLPVKLGGLRMAVMAEAQIVPVHIRNSRSAFEALAPGTKGNIPVQLEFFPALDTSGWAHEKASWLRIKDYLEECWSKASAASSAR